MLQEHNWSNICCVHNYQYTWKEYIQISSLRTIWRECSVFIHLVSALVRE